MPGCTLPPRPSAMLDCYLISWHINSIYSHCVCVMLSSFFGCGAFETLTFCLDFYLNASVDHFVRTYGRVGFSSVVFRAKWLLLDLLVFAGLPYFHPKFKNLKSFDLPSGCLQLSRGAHEWRNAEIKKSFSLRNLPEPMSSTRIILLKILRNATSS
jgi:hypothetical protein